MKHIVFVGLFLGLASVTHAEPYPQPRSRFVNDYADLLPAEFEGELAGRLAALRRETGVEMTVLTLPSQGTQSSQSLDRFARGLFDDWGIGDATRNDGVLILILRDDRAMRIELGAAYGRDWDGAAEAVIADHFLPSLRHDDYVGGLRTGSAAVIEEIVMPHRNGAAPAPGWFLPEPEALLVGGFVALWLLGAANSFGFIRVGDVWARLRVCPSCGTRGLRQHSRVVQSATYNAEGHGLRDIRCPRCDHRDTLPYTIPRITRNRSGGGSGGGGGFGGGRSGGGGASGRF